MNKQQLYEILLNFLRQNPNPTKQDLGTWARTLCIPYQIIRDATYQLIQHSAQNSPYYDVFQQNKRWPNPIGCKCHDLPPVRMRKAGFGWPASDTRGYGCPPKGWLLPPQYGVNRM